MPILNQRETKKKIGCLKSIDPRLPDSLTQCGRPLLPDRLHFFSTPLLHIDHFDAGNLMAGNKSTDINS